MEAQMILGIVVDLSLSTGGKMGFEISLNDSDGGCYDLWSRCGKIIYFDQQKYVKKEILF